MSATARRRRRLAMVWMLRAALVLVFVGAWLIAGARSSVPAIVLPPLPEVLGRLVELVQIGDTWVQSAITAAQMIVAFLLAAASGLTLGFLLSRTPWRAAVFERIFAWGYIFPVSLIYPLFLVWAGIGIPSKVLFAAVSGFFPVVYNTMKGLTAVDSRFLKVGRAFGAGRWQVDVHIRLGAARPMILSGLRLGAAMVTISVVLAEILGANAGLGYTAQQASNQFQIVDAYAYILLLVALTSVLLFVLEELLEDRRAPGR